MTPEPLKQFARVRTLEEITELCAKHGWSIDTTRYEQGADSVLIQWKHGKRRGWLSVNMATGSFGGELLPSSKYFWHDEPGNDHKPWFKALLNLVYVRAGKEGK